MTNAADALQCLPLDPDRIDATLTRWQAEQPAMALLALVPEALAPQLPVLQTACRARGILLAGAVFPAVIVDAAFSTDVVWLLRLDRPAPGFLLADLAPDAAQAAQMIADRTAAALPAPDAAGEPPTLFLLFDSQVPHIASVLDGLYLRLADRVRYAGVNAGSETFQPMPCLFDQDRVVGQGVLGLLLSGASQTLLAHGYPVPDHAMTATSTAGNQILSIDWQPAFDVYQQIIRDQYGIALTRDNFYQYAVHFPFGILQANDEVVVRIPVALTDDGALYCVGEVPENAMLVLLQAPPAAGAPCVGALLQRLKAAPQARAADPLLAFYCAGRRMHLGDDALAELAALQRDSGTPRLAGALSLGEIGSTHRGGYPMFHNAAIVCRPWHSP